MSDFETSLLLGKLFTTAYTTANLAAAGVEAVGMTMGADPVMYLTRNYSSTTSSFLIELWEEAFTGGALRPAPNRNLINASIAPASHYSGITPGGGGILRASFILQGSSSTGLSSVAVTAETEFYVLKPNTQYVLRFTNTSSQAGTLSYRFTLKKAQD